MKLLSHSNAQKSVKVKMYEETLDKESRKAVKDDSPVRKKRESKEEKEKKGRYWGVILLLCTVIAAVILRFL